MSYVLSCAKCEGFCGDGEIDVDSLPPFCPMVTKKEVIKKAKSKYDDPDISKMYSLATLNEKEAYEKVRGQISTPVRPRIRELIELVNKLELSRIGIAFCSGLDDEARKVTDILEDENFEVHSVRCKCGNHDKTEFGVPREHKIYNPDEYEAGCNPVAQAYLLNDVSTDINVIVGLCVGHDIIFTTLTLNVFGE